MSTSEDDEQFNQAFGEHTGIFDHCRYKIACIKNNKATYINRFNNSEPLDKFKLFFDNADCFTNLSWRLLGRYIANNTHLARVDLIQCGITDEKMASLFYELTYSSTLKHLDLSGNSFGTEGVRNMVPFLNDTNLSRLTLNGNNNINTDCFELLVQTLHERPLESSSLNSLFIGNCNITNISALETYNLPNLKHLVLNHNNIGRDGCSTLANILQREGSNLKSLDLDRTCIDDEGAEILATSLKHNTKLQVLDLNHNNITLRGYKAFLKLLVDVSSIENTYNSNHTLTFLKLDHSRQGVSYSIREHIRSAIQINNTSSHSAGRSKVIKYQLNSQGRKELCELQGIEYLPGSNFADIEPALLPRILALIGRRHGQSGFYTSLIPMVPELMSCVDTSGMMKDLMVKNEARDNELAKQMAELARQRAALSAKNDQLSRRLAARESSGDSRHSAIVERTGETAAESRKKRQRSK